VKVKGKGLAQAEALFEQFLGIITAPAGRRPAIPAIRRVRQFPVGVKCATLPWQALRAAAAGRVEVAQTE
jgi:nitrogen fixation NifU-like protein